MKQLSGQDALFLNAETHGLPMHLGCFSVYQGSNANLDHLENLITIRLDQELSLLRYKLYQVPYQLDFPYWVEDPEFDPVYHIQKIALASPEKPDALNKLLGRLHSQPLNAERPLWQIWIIDKLGDTNEYPENSIGLFFKIHHSLMHFGNGEKIFQALHGLADTRLELEKDNRKNLAEEGEMLHEEKAVSTFQVLSRALLNNSKQSLQLLQLAGSALSHFKNSTTTSHDLTLKRTVFNQRISASRVIERVSIPLSATPTHTDIDVFTLDLIGRALQLYLKQIEHSPDIDLIAGIPVLEDDKYGQRALFSRIKLANQEDNIKQRQGLISGELKQLKDNIELPRLANSLINNLYAPLIAWGVKSFVGSGIASVLPPLCHCIISQVPSYYENYELDDLKMIDAYGLGPLMPNVGLFHAVSIHHGNIDITITACAEHLKDPAFYKQCFVKVLDELSQQDKFLENSHQQNLINNQTKIRRKRKSTSSKPKAQKLT